MCGIAGIVSISGRPIANLERRLTLMGEMIAHRGPDGEGIWTTPDQSCGLAHRRLAIIDLSETGAQPMTGEDGATLVHNGEVYNYVELAETLASSWSYKGTSDTETILAAHAKWGDAAVEQFRGMWAYARYNPKDRHFFAARDPFGIKPFYYSIVGDLLYFASEIKAIVPFLPEVRTNADAFADYVSFQFPLSEQTLFDGVLQLMPGCSLTVVRGKVETRKYWSVDYTYDHGHSEAWYDERLRELVDDSLKLHLRADVPVGAYVSGGIDSSLIATLSSRPSAENRSFFHGKFTEFPGYDESQYAQIAADAAHGTLHQIDITLDDFLTNLPKVIYHLDHPVAGPGSFPQYMVSKLCSEHVKVVLGGQGGDEIFGGYTRYAIGYLEHALKAEIDGTAGPDVTPVTLTDMAPKLSSLREYKPMMKMLFSQGLFGSGDHRYFRLAGRASDLASEIHLDELPMAGVWDRFSDSFNAPGTHKDAVFDRMTRFDFQHLLPALLQVEDRMGMAHGLESRVPFLDKPIVEFGARLPLQVKFGGGETKRPLRSAFENVLPEALTKRRDKMGFPVPLKEWFGGGARDFVVDLFSSQVAGSRPWINQKAILEGLKADTGTFSRKVWGLVSLELWQREFHDKAAAQAKTARSFDAIDA